MTDMPDRFDADTADSHDNGGSQRLNELLAGYALGDLSAAEQTELNVVIDQPNDERLREFDLVAAAADRILRQQEPAELPDPLRQRILRDAHVYFGGRAAENDLTSAPATQSALVTPASSTPRLREWIAWICVAASLLVAVSLAMNPAKQVAVLTPQQQRATLLAGGGDVMQVAWTAGKTPFDSPVTGDVVWNNATQTGFMRFVGMPKNDPGVEQYQLWIIDPERDDEPIDGGVFDVAHDGESVIPINAKLRVISPAAFAVTIEKPGGVVVSTQERLPLLAAVN